MKASFLYYLQTELSRVKNSTILISNCQQVFGGDINTTYFLSTNEENFFVKLNTAAQADMLLKEKEGLTLLRAAKTSLKIPEPMAHGTYEQWSFLLMEYIEKGTATKILWQQLAAGLAQLHQTTQARFGLQYNNYLGTVVQNNTPASTWADFYQQQRIMLLMKQSFAQHKCTSADIQSAERFCDKLSTLIPGELPALLHGDLWSSNCLFTVNGEAAVYDPAVYFGHREMDIAMTLLFGGFDARFYTAYNEVYPLQQGWRERIAICQLYPLLVHLVLFGGRYYNSLKTILKQYDRC